MPPDVRSLHPPRRPADHPTRLDAAGIRSSGSIARHRSRPHLGAASRSDGPRRIMERLGSTAGGACGVDHEVARVRAWRRSTAPL
jgi:hypothetical protein